MVVNGSLANGGEWWLMFQDCKCHPPNLEMEIGKQHRDTVIKSIGIFGNQNPTSQASSRIKVYNKPSDISVAEPLLIQSPFSSIGASSICTPLLANWGFIDSGSTILQIGEPRVPRVCLYVFVYVYIYMLYMCVGIYN